MYFSSSEVIVDHPFSFHFVKYSKPRSLSTLVYVPSPAGKNYISDCCKSHKSENGRVVGASVRLIWQLKQLYTIFKIQIYQMQL